jgi:CubicO group peptidase (beta-lactamase class C family)
VGRGHTKRGAMVEGRMKTNDAHESLGVECGLPTHFGSASVTKSLTA